MSQTKTLLRARQAKLRDFIKETNAGKKNPILVRDYSREKIVTKIPIIKVNESDLISKKESHNDYSVNRAFVNTELFHRQFDKLPLRKAARESLYRESIKILEHRDGARYEDIVAIDARTGKVLASNTSYDVEYETGFYNSDSQMLNNYDGEIVLLHNHPASSRPSIDDLKSLHKHNAIASVVVGHHGALWLVKDSYRLENIEEHEK